MQKQNMNKCIKMVNKLVNNEILFHDKKANVSPPHTKIANMNKLLTRFCPPCIINSYLYINIGREDDLFEDHRQKNGL